MNFISPQNLGFLGLGAFIVLLYILRLKRRERVVSSTLLWESAMRDLQANAPWQKLRTSLLLWLQLLFIVLAALALARPAIKVLAGGGQNIAIILDASASMQATDVAPSRFASAQNQARALVNALASNDGATIIAAGDKTRTLIGFTRDKNALQRAINNARAADTGCDLREAITLANSLLRAGERSGSGQIYVLSDGGVAPLTDVPKGGAGIQFVKIGNRSDNLAITALSARRGYNSGSNGEVFVTVKNFGAAPKTVDLELRHDDNLIAVRKLNIAAHGTASQLFKDTGFSSGTFSARFDADDDLKSDNIAYATLDAPRAIRVLLLTQGNVFLERALNLDPNVQLSRGLSKDATPASTRGYDIVVCDGEAPKNLPESNQLLLGGAMTSMAPVTRETGEAQNPSVVDFDRRHPVTQFSPWSDIRISRSVAATPLPWGKTVVEGEKTPLVVVGERGNNRVVWCGFDLRETDLPLRVTFPIFITNALRWLSAPRGVASTRDGTPLRAGDTISLEVPDGTKTVTVTRPDKSTQQVALRDTPLLYDDTTQVGEYSAVANDAKTPWKQNFAVSLLSATESDTEPRDALKTGAGQNVGGETKARANRELWGYIVLAGLALLGLEWWVYHRGV